MRNPFEVLNVTPSSSQAEIRRAYRNLVKIYHPDVFQGDVDVATERTAELNEAYAVLQDSASFAKYAKEWYRVHTPHKDRTQHQESQYKKPSEEATDTTHSPPNPKTKLSFEQKVLITATIVIAITIIACLVGIGLYYETESNVPESTAEIHDTENVSPTVYITRTSGKYHKKSCDYLYGNGIAVSLNDALDEGYDPCKTCRPITQ